MKELYFSLIHKNRIHIFITNKHKNIRTHLGWPGGIDLGPGSVLLL